MNVILVSYDIADDKRRSRVAEVLESYGARVQFSVFWCTLSPPQRARLKATLDPELNHEKDQVLFIDVGPLEGRGSRAFSSLGRAFQPPRPGAVVL